MARAKKTAVAVAAVRTEAAVEQANGLTADSVVNKLASAQIEVQKKLGEVQATITGAIAELGVVNQAIVAKKNELKEIHGIEVSAGTLAELQLAIEQEKANAAKYEEELTQQRLRAEEKYAYEIGVRRRNETDAFNAKLQAEKKAFEAEVATVKAGFEKREADVKAAETELTKLRAEVAAHPETLKAELAKNAAVVGNAAKKEYEHQKALADKDNANTLANVQRELAVTQASNKSLAEELARTRVDLEKARQSVELLGSKALEASSGKSALDAIQKFTEQQANNSGGKK